MSDKKHGQPVSFRDYELPEGTGGQGKISEKDIHVKSRGDYDAAEQTKPSSAGLIAHTRDAAIDETKQVERVTSVDGQSDKKALDVAISHSNGDDITELQPLPTYLADNPGDEINEHDQSVDVVKNNGTADHDYVVTALKSFKQLKVKCSSAIEGKFILKIEDGPASGNFVQQDVVFVSVSNPNAELSFPTTIAAGVGIKITKENTGNHDTDMYTTIQGLEV